MSNYLAPMEGITNYIYRNAYHKYYYPMDKYFTPFLSAKPNKRLSNKEICEVDPQKNIGMRVVPQILSNSADDFIQLALLLKNEYGHEEINLNLGCPSGTVAAKGKGSGFLGEPVKLERFLDKIYSDLDLDISIKTRIGCDYEEDWDYLLKIYEKFPIKELIIHPRIRLDYYKNTPKLDAYKKAQESLNIPLCYNGDLFSNEKFCDIKSDLPDNDKWMFGRGIISNPDLLSEIYENQLPDKKKLQEFITTLYENYKILLNGDNRNVLFRMKELWAYIAPSFTNYEKYAKKIKKAQKMSEYEIIVKNLFYEQDLQGK